jgi:uncharacterized protein
MKMSGERVIPAPQGRVWEALNDPEVLRQSIPGCQEMVKRSPTEFSAKVMAKVGPVKASFAGDVTLSKLNPPHSYLITGQGTGGAAGFAEGGAEVRLEDVGGQTRLIYDVDAKVGGKLAQIGSRLIDSTARRMADDFFKRFAEVVTSSEPQAEREAETPVQPAETPLAPARTAPARKAAASRTPATRKSAAKKTAARKTAAAKPPRRSRGESAQPPEFTAGPETTQPPPPEAAIAPLAASAPSRAPSQAPVPATNIWWLVIAGLAALLVIVVLASV